ncbi:hypothetical protein [Streptomyces sp. WZ-12]|uniref:hypothetical protein n=1 Tax=Streptomyces sp. WZ-12 TaxID=3030210 RepID=UPI00406C69DB
MLQDAESLGPHPGTDGLVLTGLDDYEGPPEGHRGPAQLHNQRHWLGSCRKATRRRGDWPRPVMGPLSP